MPKNIILCSDGTGNTAIKGRGTNVFKLFEAVDLNEHRTNPVFDTQLAFYDDGVGTGSNPVMRIVGEATGWGLKSNVKQLYRELTRVYDEGDHIFLFGFSRGAFTVRTLAGMIGTCGILKGEGFPTARALREAVDAAYIAYRARYDSSLTRMAGHLFRGPGGQAAIDAFRERFETQLHSTFTIDFIGVWDTVDAVGLPFALADIVNRRVVQFKFRARGLDGHVLKTCHALSIDDPRTAFEPVLWTGPDDRVEQVWFSGVHSNVGGGYPKQGMSLVALDWMLAQAQQAGLRLLPLDHELFRGHASVDDAMYNPRSGFGLFYRWMPRDIRDFCRRSCETPRIHLTVAERIAHGTDDYAPGNIPPDVEVTFTPIPRHDPNYDEKTRLLQQRAAAVQAQLRAALGTRSYLLDTVKRDIALGDASYWLFVTAGFLLAVGAGGLGVQALRTTWSWPFAFVAALSLLLLATASLLAHVADARMSDAFSQFWHQHQKGLRAAMKQAHRHAKHEKQALYA